MFANNIIPAIASVLPPRFWQSVLRVPILLPYYHVVSDEEVLHVKHLYRFRNVRTFCNDLDYLARRFTPIGLADLLANLQQGRTLPARPMLLTFDDGFREMHDVAAPILRSKGIPATFFLAPAFLDNLALCHNEKASVLVEHFRTHENRLPVERIVRLLNEAGVAAGEIATRLTAVNYHQRRVLDDIASLVGCDFTAYLKSVRPYLTGEQVHRLVKDGFTIGSHSIDHPLYRLLTLAEQLKQTRISTQEVKNRFGVTYAAFAFPHTDTGVAKGFFTTTYGNRELDISFGTGGLLADEIPQHFQRFSMEKTLQSAEWILSRQYARRLSRTLSGRATVRHVCM